MNPKAQVARGATLSAGEGQRGRAGRGEQDGDQ